MMGMQIAEKQYIVARSRSTIAHSLARIERAAHGMARPWKRCGHAIRGGSVPAFDDVSSEVRARVRAFVNPAELPRIVAGYSTHPKPCDACAKVIAQGEPEYEVAFSTLTFRLDADCYGLWTVEMVRAAHAERPYRASNG